MNFLPANLNGRLAKLLSGKGHALRAAPARDWAVVMSVTLVLIVGIGFWSYFLYSSFTTRRASSVPTGSASAPAASIGAVNAVFSARSMTQTHYLTDYHFVDPSK